MKVLLGLGNPGSRYEQTRHNIGWLVLDAIAERLRIEFEPGKGDYYRAEGSWRGRKVVLIKPTTWMNNSGEAAVQALRHYRSTIDDLIIVVDEYQFPVGKIKMTPNGSSGGHNGVESLLYHLQSDRFARLRCGVGNDFGPGGMADYVLSNFASDERDELQQMITDSRDALLTWIVDGTSRAMTEVNSRSKKRAAEAKKGGEENNESTGPQTKESSGEGDTTSTNF